MGFHLGLKLPVLSPDFCYLRKTGHIQLHNAFFFRKQMQVGCPHQGAIRENYGTGRCSPLAKLFSLDALAKKAIANARSVPGCWVGLHERHWPAGGEDTTLPSIDVLLHDA